MRVFTTSAEHLKQVSDLLLRGEVVAVPTETVYGLAADALNPEAVEKIYSIKGRPSHNPLIIHVANIQTAERYVTLNPTAKKLMDAFWPGSLTLVLKKKTCIPDIVTAGLKTVGIRCPRHEAMHSILEHLDRPLAAPSANPSNYISPTRVEHVTSHLEGRLHYAVDGGVCEAGVESTILDVSDESSPKLLRPGPVTLEELENFLGKSILTPTHHQSASDTSAVSSPGQLKLHYSPRTPLTLLETDTYPTLLTDSVKYAFIRFSRTDTFSEEMIDTYDLTADGDAKSAEKNLYSLLQELDTKGYHHIFAAPIPSGPKWNAVRDRLTRAASR